MNHQHTGTKFCSQCGAKMSKGYGWKHVIVVSILVLALSYWMHKPEQEAAVGRAVNATATAR